MLNSAEHEIFSANKNENANSSWQVGIFILAEKFSCSAVFSKKIIAIVSNLRFIRRTNFMLSWVERERRFITSGPGFYGYKSISIFFIFWITTYLTNLDVSVGCASDWWWSGGQSQQGLATRSLNIFYVILPFPLIQEGQLSVSGKKMCTSTVKHLED